MIEFEVGDKVICKYENGVTEIIEKDKIYTVREIIGKAEKYLLLSDTKEGDSNYKFCVDRFILGYNDEENYKTALREHQRMIEI